MEIKDKIKSQRIKQNLTLEEVAKRVGVTKATVQRWESGLIANMKRDKIILLAQALATTPAYILDIEEDKMQELPKLSTILPIKKQKIPLLGAIACGKPIMANEDRESYVEIGTEIHADFCLKAQGDSMVGARIEDGDIVFIRQQPVVENGEIAAVLIGDTATLKRVYYDEVNKNLILNAENPKYPPMVYNHENLDKVKILGKAIAFQSDIK